MPAVPVSIKRSCVSIGVSISVSIGVSISLWGCASSVDMVRAAEEINAMRAQLDRATRDAQEAKKIAEESRAIAAQAKRSAEQVEAEFKAMNEASQGSEIRVLPVR